MKKQLILLVVLIIISLALGALAYASYSGGIKKAESAIDEIGTVTYSEKSKTLIDAADEAIAAIDPNFKPEEKISNLETLKSAKVRYVEQAIIRLYRAVRDKQDEDTIKEYLSDAQAAFDRYLTEEDVPLVHNYSDLEDAIKRYGSDNTDSRNLLEDSPNLTPNQTTIDIC